MSTSTQKLFPRQVIAKTTFGRQGGAGSSDETGLAASIRKASTSVLLLGLVTWFMLSAGYAGTFNPHSILSGVGDFKFFYSGAYWLDHGQTLYRFDSQGSTYVYPPLLALALRPLALLPLDTATHPWYFVSALSLLTGIALYGRAAGMSWRNSIPLCIMVITGFKFWPTVMTFGLGTADMLLVLAVCGMIFADSRGKLGTLAICIAVAGLIKTWMLGMLLYLIVRRAWKPIGVCIGAWIGGLAALFTIVGWHEFPMWLRLTRGYASGHIGTNVASQSIKGFARLHFGTNEFVQPLIHSALLCQVFIVVGFLAVFAGLAYLWRLGPAQSSYERRLRLGLVMLSVLLLSPFCQTQYYILALPLLWTMLAPPDKDKAKVPALAMASSLAVYFLLTRGGPYYSGGISAAYQHGLATLRVSTPFYGGAALWAIALCAIHASRRVKDEEDAPTVVYANPPEALSH